MTQSICLAMIAKNEEKTIGRAIRSCVGLIDSVCVIDTGSTDHTIREVRDVCRRNKLPLTLEERPWEDFATNRTQLLQLARPLGTHLLLLDCDMTVEVISKPELDPEVDAFMLGYSGPSSWRAKFLITTRRGYRYQGRVHEYGIVDTPEPPERVALLDDIVLTHHGDGGGDTQDWKTKAVKYFGLLLQDYVDDPTDPRTLYYMANTAGELGMTGFASDMWKVRAAMEGTFEEERWDSQLKAAVADDDPIALLACWNSRPHRCEPLYHLAMWHRLQGNYHAAEMFAREGHLLPFPDSELLFVDRWLYDWGCDFEWAIALWWTGQKEVARQLNEAILARDDVPEDFRRAVMANLGMDKANPKVVATVPVKDNLRYTKGIVDQLEAAEVPAVILDNGSEAETADWLWGAQSKLVSVGKAPGKTIHEMWNLGIEWALGQEGATAVAILNNDLALGPSALQRCAAVLDDDLVLVCPNYDKRNIDGVQLTQEICAGRYDGTGGIAGFAMVLSLDWVRKTNYRFPDDLTWWYGDNDLLMTVIDSGCQAGIVGDATCVHLDGGSKTGNWDDPSLNPVLAADREAFLRKWSV